MFVLAIVPVFNFFMYSGHGGLAWFLIPFCCPYIIIRSVVRFFRLSGESRTEYKRFLIAAIPSYVVAAVPLSWIATVSIHHSFGLEASTWVFFEIMVSPFPWWYLT